MCMEMHKCMFGLQKIRNTCLCPLFQTVSNVVIPKSLLRILWYPPRKCRFLSEKRVVARSVCTYYFCARLERPLRARNSCMKRNIDAHSWTTLTSECVDCEMR